MLGGRLRIPLGRHPSPRGRLSLSPTGPPSLKGKEGIIKCRMVSLLPCPQGTHPAAGGGPPRPQGIPPLPPCGGPSLKLVPPKNTRNQIVRIYQRSHRSQRASIPHGKAPRGVGFHSPREAMLPVRNAVTLPGDAHDHTLVMLLLFGKAMHSVEGPVLSGRERARISLGRPRQSGGTAVDPSGEAAMRCHTSSSLLPSLPPSLSRLVRGTPNHIAGALERRLHQSIWMGCVAHSWHGHAGAKFGTTEESETEQNPA